MRKAAAKEEAFKKQMAAAKRWRREVCKLLDARPFQSFALTFGSRRHVILDPASVLVTNLAISIGIPRRKGSRYMKIVYLCGFYNLKLLEKNLKRSPR